MRSLQRLSWAPPSRCLGQQQGRQAPSWRAWRRHCSPARWQRLQTAPQAAGGSGGDSDSGGGGGGEIDIDALAARLSAEAEKLRQSGMSIDPEEDAEEEEPLAASSAAAAAATPAGSRAAGGGKENLLQPLGYEVRGNREIS